MRGVGVAFLAGDRGDVDDAAVFLGEHRRHDRLAADEGAVEIDAQHLAPLLEIGLPYRLVDAGDTGIVDEDIDLAERLQRVVAGLFHRGQVGHVDLERGDGGADLFRRLLGQRLVMVPDRDLGAGGHKALRDRAPKPLRAAGYDGASAVEIDLVHGEGPFTSIWHRLLRLRKSTPSPALRGERRRRPMAAVLDRNADAKHRLWCSRGPASVSSGALPLTRIASAMRSDLSPRKSGER